MEKITKEMTIGDVVQKYPALAAVLTDEGVHCVGCGAAYHETLEQGLTGHGKTEEQIKNIIVKMNDSIPTEISNDNLTITEDAALKAKELLIKKDNFNALRVKVISGGCAGNQYSFSFENEPKDDDQVIEVGGVNFFIDFNSMTLLKGSKIDYLNTLNDSGFKISNPNASNTCGCGSSFS